MSDITLPGWLPELCHPLHRSLEQAELMPSLLIGCTRSNMLVIPFGEPPCVIDGKVSALNWMMQTTVILKPLRVNSAGTQWQWQPTGWQSRIAKVMLEEWYGIEFMEVYNESRT